MSETYFFAVLPRYLKVEHSFAKTIKPNTKYRLVVYKGIQKCDQQKEGIKSKLVGGKIDIQSPELFFNIPFYSPTKNIQFTIKLYEEKPNEGQAQIASYAIMSSDFVRSYKNQNQPYFQVDGKLKDDISIAFDLVVEKSKYSLTDALKKYSIVQHKSSKSIPDQNKSQSSRSKQVVREGDGFISPRKRIERKSGHKGKLRSRNSSRQDGEVSPEGSVASSRRRWRKSPPSKQGEHFLHSPKKASPPKVGADSKGKSIPKSEASSKSVGQKVETQSNAEVNQRSYKYQGNNQIKYADTKEVFDLKMTKDESPQKTQLNQRPNLVEKTPLARSNIVSAQSPQSPTSQSGVKPSISQSSVVQPASNVQKSIVSPRNSKVGGSIAQLQVKHTSQVFDLVPKKNVTSPVQSPRNQSQKSIPVIEQSKSSQQYQYQPPKSPKVSNNAVQSQNPSINKPEITPLSPPKSPKQEKIQEKPVIVSRSSVKKVEPQVTQNLESSKPQPTAQPVQSAQLSRSRKSVQNQSKQSISLQVSNSPQKLEQSNVRITLQGTVTSPKAKIIEKDDNRSEKISKDIEVKPKQVKRQKDKIHESSTLRGSMRLSESTHQKQHDDQQAQAKRVAEERKMMLYYVIFLVVSAFLIYNAMMPTRRV